MTAKLRKSGVVRPSSLGGLSYSGVQFEGSLLKYDRAVYIKLSKLSTNGMMTRPARQRRMLVPRDLLPNDVSLSTSPSLSAVATLQEQGGEISISKISILYDNDAGGLSERVRDLFIGSPYAASGSSSGSSSRSSSPGRSTSRPSSFLSVEERSVSRPITPKRSPPPARMQTSSPGGTSLQAMTTPYSPASSISTVAANGNKYAQVPRESQPVARPQSSLIPAGARPSSAPGSTGPMRYSGDVRISSRASRGAHIISHEPIGRFPVGWKFPLRAQSGPMQYQQGSMVTFEIGKARSGDHVALNVEVQNFVIRRKTAPQ